MALNVKIIEEIIPFRYFMKKTPSLENLLIQINEVIHQMTTHQGPIAQNFTPEINARLEALETAVSIFHQHQQETFKEANIDIERLTQETIESSSPNRQQQFLKRAQEMQRDAHALHAALTQATKGKRGQKKRSSRNSSEQQQIKERRKLFKPLGGDKTWIPL